MRICPECERTFEDHVLRCPHDGDATVSVPDKPTNKLVGTLLDGRWRIVRLLGEGGMGAVFEGRQVNLDRPVAIKVLQPELAQRDIIIARFMREARVMSALRHPHIVTILDFGRDEASSLLYLVMELLEGSPLNLWLRKNRPTYQQCLDIIEQTARALASAHQGQVIHRDLKPHNIFLTPMGASFHLKVLDFGIAKLQAPDASTLTNTGDIQGTPHYMAPEQIEAGTIVPQTDLYALGVMGYELITGRVPFEAPSSLPIFFKHCHEPPPPIEGRWALEVPPQPPLIALVMELLSKRPEERPIDAQAVIERVAALRAPDLSLSWEVELPALASTMDMRASSPSLERGQPPASFATPAKHTPVTRAAQQSAPQQALDKGPLQSPTAANAALPRPGLVAAGAFGLGAVTIGALTLALAAIALIAAWYAGLISRPAEPTPPAAVGAPPPSSSPTPPLATQPDAQPDAPRPAAAQPDAQPDIQPDLQPDAPADAAPTDKKPDKRPDKKRPSRLDDELKGLDKVGGLN